MKFGPIFWLACLARLSLSLYMLEESSSCAWGECDLQPMCHEILPPFSLVVGHSKYSVSGFRPSSGIKLSFLFCLLAVVMLKLTQAPSLVVYTCDLDVPDCQVGLYMRHALIGIMHCAKMVGFVLYVKKLSHLTILVSFQHL